MYKENGQLYYSPTDLTRHMESPFASWLSRYAIERPQLAPAKDPKDEVNETLAKKGHEHEEAVAGEFLRKNLSLVKIPNDSLAEARRKTLAAMREGVAVIAQARLEFGQFAGFSDFLVKQPGSSKLGDHHYEVWDAKLASKNKPTFVTQLCCYAEMLEAMQEKRPEFITVALGNGKNERLQLKDYYYYYHALKKAFISSQENFDPAAEPDPAESASWGDYSDYAQRLILAKDHLSQVATITRGQIKKLKQAGVQTMRQLADCDLEHVPGIYPAKLKNLKSQALAQKRSVGKDKPYHEIITPPPGEQSGLALLPPRSSGDVFFDIEGYSLETGGLEYLWGCAYFDESGKRNFKDFWAHDHKQEKAAFAAFIKWVYARWQLDRTMHIYHYANYEIAACRKLMGRYGVYEHEVDQLLRNDVFVDLYKVVKGGLLLGEPSYSIKNVEHLYREQRSGEIKSGEYSLAVYEKWRELNQLGEEGDSWQTSKLLKNIRDYNIDDCYSTSELTVWLRKQQQTNNIAYLAKTETNKPEEREEISESSKLRDRMLSLSKLESDPKRAELTETLAWTLEFHRRENKPMFWRMFERLAQSHTDLFDDLDCLALCKRTSRAPFKPTQRARNLAYEYRFDPTQDFKGLRRQFYLLGAQSENGKTPKVTIEKKESDLRNGLIVVKSKNEPPPLISLIADEYVSPEPLRKAIYRSVSEYANGEMVANSAIIDFLTRSKPRVKGHKRGPLAPSNEPEERLRQIIRAVKNLDNSYLTIQGPPGSGKSRAGARVISELVKNGAKVGIASNSHKAINNLLLSAAKYCAQQGIAGSFARANNYDPELEKLGVDLIKGKKPEDCVAEGSALGATAWTFAREEMSGKLDYLFVDEAGQVSMANLVAMSGSANNLILMGDQMQLGQPSQGVHPMDSGLSILDYLLRDTPTIPDDMGVFLETTYRMHSRINQRISEHVYDSKLKARKDNDKRVIEVQGGYVGPLNKDSGIVFIPTPHSGNTQASDQEAAKIAQLARSLMGRVFHTGESDQATRPIGWDDVLFVAPYNHQVNKLQTALGSQAKVGSVDKFQGQEAPVVFLSMCASDPGESPRGVDFLFDKHRLNVAISRAQTLAVVVANPDIAWTPVKQVRQLKLLNLFNAIIDSQHH